MRDMGKLPPRARRMIESDRTRGMVPAGADAHLDTRYAKYLEEIDLEHDAGLLNALAAAPDPRFRDLLKYLTLPSADTKPIVYWVKRAGIDLLEMMTWFGKEQNARMLAIAQRAGVKINEHMAIDGESRMIACDRCDGLGWVQADDGLPPDTPGYRILRMVKVKHKGDDGQQVEEEVPVWIRNCPMSCDHGKLRQPGDEFSREKLLEQCGVIGKKGIGFQLIQHFGGQSMPSAVARLDVMTIDVESTASD